MQDMTETKDTDTVAVNGTEGSGVGERTSTGEPASVRALIVLTGHGTLGDTGRPTGFYVSEAAHPWQAFTRAGWTVDFVSPEGGRPPTDGEDRTDPVQRAFLDDPDVAAKLADTPTPAQVDPAAYDVVFHAGGHGAMWDLPGDVDLAGITARVYEAGGVVGAVCHGPAGLVDVRLSDGSYLVAGRRVSAFTNAEERAVGLDGVVPFPLQTRLEERGATHSGAPDFTAHVVADGRLVTGQNPASAAGVAERIIEVVRHHTSLSTG